MDLKDYRFASYCSSPAWGGLEMHVLRFLRWMSERGRQAVFYGDPATRLYREAIQAGIPAYAVVQRLRTGDVLCAAKLARIAKGDNVRWLIVHRSADYFAGALARTLSGDRLRLIYHQHMHIGKNKRDPYHRWLYRRPDAFVTPVPWLAERVLQKTSVPKERLHTIPQGIEIAPLTAGKPDESAARAKLGLPLDAIVIGLVGRLDPKKGQDIAIEALARLHQNDRRAHLLLVGEQSFAEGDAFAASVRALVNRHGLRDHVHFVSFLPEVEWAYAAMDIFVLASKSECYGMVTVEAMAAGLPVVGTNDGGTVSIIDSGRNGLLVTPRNVDELAAALMKLLDDPALASRLGRTAHEEAIVKYTHSRQCEAWERLFESLARCDV
ncbi:MAG: glycosyltransferase family 4 protein [Candidatus Zixiibacteriota bacterium]